MKNRFVYHMILKDWLKRRIFGQSTPIRKTWAETPAEITDLVEFMNWFDATSSIEDTVRAAERDWQFRFVQMPHFDAVKKDVAMEIGFGGGRLLAQAAKSFDRVVGVDIHRAFDNTKRFLELQDCRNFRLVHRDDLGSVADGSVDFVYSFIVFQHFDSVEEVEFYLDQIQRLLQDDGVAHIYYGKSKGVETEVTSDKAFILRDCSLFVAPERMRDFVAKRFDILEYQDRLPKKPDSDIGESGQARIVFRKKK